LEDGLGLRALAVRVAAACKWNYPSWQHLAPFLRQKQ
jgi:hypothetical protein